MERNGTNSYKRDYYSISKLANVIFSLQFLADGEFGSGDQDVDTFSVIDLEKVDKSTKFLFFFFFSSY